MKKKGFTVVELIVSFSLVFTIAVLLLQVILNLKDLYVNSGIKTQLLNKQAIITNEINKKLIDKKIDNYTRCGEDCLRFTYLDGTSEDLVINRDENYIEFNNNRTYLLDNSNFGSIILDTFNTPVQQQNHNDSMLVIHIPIYYNNNNSKDYGVKIIYQYNSNGNDIVITDPNLKNLHEELLKQYNENNTVGLLKETNSNSYYYKGTNEEVSNNYVWFAGHLWRVISINEDNSLTMITGQPITAISLTNTVWQNEQEYKDSYINQWFNNVFLESMKPIDKVKIQDHTFNIGSIDNINAIQTVQKVGLLDEEQYKKAGNGVTGQNSYLDIKDYFWLGNPYSSAGIRDVMSDGSFNDSDLTFAFGVRPVIRVSGLNFNEGEGTLTNPYREKSKITNISSIKVGEYISVPTSSTDCGSDNRCLFRVVSQDNNSVKIILNGLLPNPSIFNSTGNETYVNDSEINTTLTNFANTISDTYRYTENNTFNIGLYGYGMDYSIVNNATYSGNVGLPVVGEIFSGNDIDVPYPGVSTKVFVNVNTIENPTAASYFWVMNRYSTSYERDIYYEGFLGNSNVTEAYGTRPVLFLKNNLTFVSGEGTAENPFILGE